MMVRKALDVRYLNPLLKALMSVHEALTQEKLEIGKPSIISNSIIANDVVVIMGVSKQVRGQVILNLSTSSALWLAGKMMGGTELDGFNDIAKSAVSEFMNMVLGNAGSLYENDGIIIDIVPPLLVIGRNLELDITKEIVPISVPLTIASNNKIGFTVDILLESMDKVA